MIVNLKERKRNKKGVHLTPQAPHTAASSFAAHHSVSTPQNLHELEDDNEEDWETFRHFVKIIQIVGELITKYEGLEELLNKKIHQFLIAASDSSNSIVGQHVVEAQFDQKQLDLFSIESFKLYLLENNDRVKLNNLIAVIASGFYYSDVLLKSRPFI